MQPSHLRPRPDTSGTRRQESHPEAGGDQAADRARLVAFADGVRYESRLAAGVVGEIARPVTPLGVDERLRCDLPEGDPPAPREAMSRGDGQQDFFGEQRHGADGRTCDERGREAEVDLPADQPRLHLRRRGLRESEVDPRVALEEGAQEVGEEAQGRRRDGHGAAFEARQVGEFLASILHLSEDAFHMPQKRPPACVEDDPPPPPIEERHPQLRLEPRDRLAERRLRDHELLGGSRHMFEPGDCPEIVQLE